jgi:hypothetical protein
LAIASPTSGGRSVGVVRSRTQTMEFSFSFRVKKKKMMMMMAAVIRKLTMV